MTRLTTASVALALLAWPALASASAEAFKSLEPHVLYEAAPSQSDEAALYETVGLAGERMVIEVRSPTNVEVTVHTFRGEAMLSQSSSGTVAVEIVLPLDDIYFVSVLRKDPANAFTIRRTRVGDLPDRYLAAFAEGVGFRNESYSSCWIVPGLLKKLVMPTAIKEIGIGAQGREYQEVFFSDGTIETSLRKRRFTSEDESILAVHNNGNLKQEFVQKRSEWKTGFLKDYWRYLCE